MFYIWVLFMGIITTTEAFLLAGMAATIKTYSEHFPWFIPDGNSSLQHTIMASSRFDINTDKPTTLKEYLQELPTDQIDNHQNYSSGTWADSKVVVVARIGDYINNENRGEWAVIAEPKERNETLNNNRKNNDENSTESSDYFLGNEDFQQYLNDYQDLLYTFKDFVQIGANPNIRKNVLQYNMSNENREKVFNVTYVMPIPKTKKYFEIKLSNLTKTQYNEINSLLQKHILRKTNSKEITKSKEEEIVYVDEKNVDSSFISHALSDPLSSHSDTSKPMLQSGRVTKDLLRENKTIPDYFGPLLTPEGFNYFLNNFHSIHINLNNKSVDQTIFQHSSSPPTLIQNNGFHAEIATDYVERYNANSENNAQENSFSQKDNNYKGLSGFNYEQTTVRSILNPHLKRNKSKLFIQTRSKRPIMNAPDNVLNTQKRKISPTSVSFMDQPNTTVPSNLPPNPSYDTTESNFNSIYISPNPMVDEIHGMKRMNLSQNITNIKGSKIPEKNTTASISAKDWIEINKLYNSSLTKSITPLVVSNPSLNIINDFSQKSSDSVSKPLTIMEVAEWLIDFNNKMDEHERKRTERYKNYIKQYLGGDKDSSLLGRDNNSTIMKINKQENILKELKFLMLNYFASLHFKTQEAISNNSSSTVESIILNTTNIFELMEQSSRLLKLNLHTILRPNTQEPAEFVKRIAEKQIERCKKTFDKGLIIGAKQKSTGSTQKSGHRLLAAFTKCMNLKLKRCIQGFSLWLEKGKFFLRPQFKLNRAYENYEIERNLYCLRNYNPSSLDSSPHGVRIKLWREVNRNSEPEKIKARPNRQKIGMKSHKGNHLKNKQQNGKLNTERSRIYKQQQIRKQQPQFQKYSGRQAEDQTMQKS